MFFHRVDHETAHRRVDPAYHQPDGRPRAVKLIIRPDGSAVEPSPDYCPVGHRLGPRQVTVGWLPCSCAGGRGHRTWQCETCEAVLYDPSHNPTGTTAQA